MGAALLLILYASVIAGAVAALVAGVYDPDDWKGASLGAGVGVFVVVWLVAALVVALIFLSYGIASITQEMF